MDQELDFDFEQLERVLDFQTRKLEDYLGSEEITQRCEAMAGVQLSRELPPVTKGFSSAIDQSNFEALEMEIKGMEDRMLEEKRSQGPKAKTKLGPFRNKEIKRRVDRA